MKRRILIPLFAAALIVSAAGVSRGSGVRQDFSPKLDEQQLPKAMHSAMKELPSITVGRNNADIIGSDNCALQAAVDYIAGLGGGIVEIGEGEFLMYDSKQMELLLLWLSMAILVSSKSRWKIQPDLLLATVWRFGTTVQGDFIPPSQESPDAMETHFPLIIP